MRIYFLSLLLTAVTLCCIRSASAEAIPHQIRNQQSQTFVRWWDTDLVWKFDELPTAGTVPDFRLPYSGSTYPDNQGGTAVALRKYDRAFHRGRPLATRFEEHDIEVHKELRAGLLGMLAMTRTPHWAGHCNGWVAAALRHAEPAKNVNRGGVVFTPADIKGLLAELYTYTDIEPLSAEEGVVHPAIFHVVLANWIGRQKHPIAMDSEPGKEVWNYPIYAYRSSFAKRGALRVEVKTNIGYVDYTLKEFDKGPRLYKYMDFHYTLELDAAGKIIGGRYHRGSNRTDLLWVPLKPAPGGEKGNELGNPHLDVKTVMSLWRDSTPEALRSKWVTIDPLEEDRVAQQAEREVEVEVQEKSAVEQAPREAAPPERESPSPEKESQPPETEGQSPEKESELPKKETQSPEKESQSSENKSESSEKERPAVEARWLSQVTSDS